MKKHLSKKLELLVGRLSDLTIENHEENFVSNGGAEMAAGVTAVGLTAAGLAGAATNSLAVAGGGTDSVQAFMGVVNGKHVHGRFSKIWFRDGDHIECAVDPQSDGSYAVYAVRRPSDQTLWMFPHCSRGRTEHWRYARKMCVILALIITTSLLLALTPIFGFALWADKQSSIPATVFVVMGILMGFHFSINTAVRWAPFVAIAESIFTALGYANPARVDMVEQDKKFRKAEGAGAEASNSAPWVFRYVE